MARTYAVIGANFGDEGKGLLTDALARRLQAPLVARFNGGCQAGHTVIQGGLRHVFSTVSAGTFAGANTYLSSKFIVNPFVMARERESLISKGVQWPSVVAHKDAKVTLLYDMALNSLSELMRDQVHGSCGVGINETVTRNLADADCALDLEEVVRWDLNKLTKKLKQIRADWVPQRLGTFRSSAVDLMNLPRFHDRAQVLFDVLESIEYKKQAIAIKTSVLECFEHSLILRSAENVILEGAQGLALDESLGEFPHVTRSITGLPYAIIAAAELKRRTIKPLYITRSYLTRHGAGPLTFDDEIFTGDMHPIDTTNVANEHQGIIRFAPLNLEQLKRFISADRERAAHVGEAHGIRIEEPELAITCLDQLKDMVKYVDIDGQLKEIMSKLFPQFVASRLDIKLGAISYGPEAKDVQFI